MKNRQKGYIFMSTYSQKMRENFSNFMKQKHLLKTHKPLEDLLFSLIRRYYDHYKRDIANLLHFSYKGETLLSGSLRLWIKFPE